jgi:hypothetical protein
VVIGAELSGARFAEVTDEGLAHNRIVRPVPRTELPFFFRRCARRRKRAERSISAPIRIGPSDATGQRWDVINARFRHGLVAWPTLRKGGGTSWMKSQTSETTNLGASAAPKALIPGSKTQVRRKTNSVRWRAAVAAAFRNWASADSDGRIRRRSGVGRGWRRTVVRRR